MYTRGTFFLWGVPTLFPIALERRFFSNFFPRNFQFLTFLSNFFPRNFQFLTFLSNFFPRNFQFLTFLSNFFPRNFQFLTFLSTGIGNSWERNSKEMSGIGNSWERNSKEMSGIENSFIALKMVVFSLKTRSCFDLLKWKKFSFASKDSRVGFPRIPARFTTPRYAVQIFFQLLSRRKIVLLSF